MDVAACATGVANQLKTIATFSAVSITEPAQITPPHAWVRFDGFDETYEAMNAGLSSVRFTVVVAGSLAGGQPLAQANMYPYLSAGTGFDQSVLNVLTSDQSFGEVCSSSKVESISGLQRLELLDGTQFLGVEWTVTLHGVRT